MSDFRQASKGFFWNHLGRVSEYLLMYAFTLLVARTLGPASNGLYATFISSVQLLMVLASFGLETVVFSRLPMQQVGDSSYGIIARNLLLTRFFLVIVACAVLMIFGNALAVLFKIPTDLVKYGNILFSYFAFRSINSMLSVFLLAKFQTKTISIVNVAMRGVELVVGYGLIRNGFGLQAIFILISSVACVGMIVYIALLKDVLFVRSEKASLITTPLLMKPLMVFGGLIWINGLLEFILSKQADVFLLNYFIGDPAVVGVYDVATSFGQMINFGLTAGMYGVSIVSFSSLLGSDLQAAPLYWKFLNRIVLLVLVPAFVVCIWFAGRIVPLLYSNTYAASIILFQVFSAFLLTTRILSGGISADYIQAIARPKILLLSSAISGGVNLVCAIGLIPKYGAMGALFATGSGMLTIAGIQGFYVCNALNVKLQIGFAMKIIIGAIVCTVFASLLQQLAGVHHPIISLFVFVLLFWFLMLLIQPLKDEELRFFGELDPRVTKWIKLISAGPAKLTSLTDRQKWAYAWLPKSDRLVDIGSSASPLHNVLLQKCNEVIAVDIDGDLLRQAKEINQNVFVMEASASLLPLGSESCDAALLLDVLEHVKEEQETIDEAWRVLKPGGVLIISVPHKGLFRFLDPQNFKSRLTHTLSNQTQHRHYSEDELLRFLGLKFAVLRKHYGGLFLYPLTFAGNNFIKKHFQADWGRFWKKAGDWDNDFSWGKFSYNLILLARKVS